MLVLDFITHNIILQALYYRKYSTASDVWSYGVLMFEIWSMGKKPFSSISNEQVSIHDVMLCGYIIH